MKENTTSEELRSELKALQNQEISEAKERLTKDGMNFKTLLMTIALINGVRYELYLPIELCRIGNEIRATHHFGVWIHGSTPISEGSYREDFRTVDFYKKMIEAYTEGVLRMLIETKGIKKPDYIPDELELSHAKRKGYVPGEYKNLRALMKEARGIAYRSGYYCDEDESLGTIEYHAGDLHLRLFAVGGKGDPDGCQYHCVVVEY